MKLLFSILIAINMIVMISSSISITVASINEENYIDIISTKKPKWCNSFSLDADDSFTFEKNFLQQQQKEYKYPCAQLI